MCLLAVFESHFGHFVCKMGQNGDFLGGLEGSKMSFLGPKPTQDPMNIVFEQKNS